MKRTFTLLAVTGLIAAISLLYAASRHSSVQAGMMHDEENLPRETRRELAKARKATARYRDIGQAMADGYADINVVVPNMGRHYLKAPLLDDHFDPEKPELLVYAATTCDSDKLRLVAVEYAVPIAQSATPPEGFSGDHDEWDRNETFGLWTLHAWIWYENPDGVFAELNPRVP